MTAKPKESRLVLPMFVTGLPESLFFIASMKSPAQFARLQPSPGQHWGNGLCT